MLSPDHLLPLWLRHRDAIETPIREFSLSTHDLNFSDRAYQMAVINLSRDSSYRESICLSLDQAIYRGRRLHLEGAPIIDIGAESTGVTARRVGADEQDSLLLPVIRGLNEYGIATSAETYFAEVAAHALEAGAAVINMTGAAEAADLYRVVAKHDASVIICYAPGENPRDDDALPSQDEIIDVQLDYFRNQLDLAQRQGVERIWIDPGIGFHLNLPDGPERIVFQVENTLLAFRFRVLGWPICVTLPSSVAMFREEVRSAETGFAVMCMLSKANLIRSHEAARVQPIVETQDLPRRNARQQG